MGIIEDYYARLKAFKAANTPKSSRPAVSPANVIDQGLFGGAVSRIPAEANRLLQRAKAAPSELNALAGPQGLQQMNQLMANPPKANPQQWMDAGMELSGMAPISGLIGATVYHGSPHKFDKFDMSKIGTGEGNQAYGHGLYFAEAPDVAEGYARDLSMRYTGETMPQLKARMKQIQDTMQGPGRMAALNEVRGQMALAKSGAGKTPQMYKVDIPDEAIPRMLDWDKSFAEQPKHVQDALKKTGFYKQAQSQFKTEKQWHLDPKQKTGESLYQYLQGGVGDSAGLAPDVASDYLKQAGIPGIRYLDGNSRGHIVELSVNGKPYQTELNRFKSVADAEQYAAQKQAEGFTTKLKQDGTSNFVLFDDQLPRILETNGVPTGAQPWAQDAIGLNGKPIDPRGKVRK